MIGRGNILLQVIYRIDFSSLARGFVPNEDEIREELIEGLAQRRKEVLGDWGTARDLTQAIMTRGNDYALGYCEIRACQTIEPLVITRPIKYV